MLIVREGVAVSTHASRPRIARKGEGTGQHGVKGRGGGEGRYHRCSFSLMASVRLRHLHVQGLLATLGAGGKTVSGPYSRENEGGRGFWPFPCLSSITMRTGNSDSSFDGTLTHGKKRRETFPVGKGRSTQLSPRSLVPHFAFSSGDGEKKRGGIEQSMLAVSGSHGVLGPLGMIARRAAIRIPAVN